MRQHFLSYGFLYSALLILSVALVCGCKKPHLPPNEPIVCNFHFKPSTYQQCQCSDGVGDTINGVGFYVEFMVNGERINWLMVHDMGIKSIDIDLPVNTDIHYDVYLFTNCKDYFLPNYGSLKDLPRHLLLSNQGDFNTCVDKSQNKKVLKNKIQLDININL